MAADHLSPGLILGQDPYPHFLPPPSALFPPSSFSNWLACLMTTLGLLLLSSSSSSSSDPCPPPVPSPSSQGGRGSLVSSQLKLYTILRICIFVKVYGRAFCIPLNKVFELYKKQKYNFKCVFLSWTCFEIMEYELLVSALLGLEDLVAFFL